MYVCMYMYTYDGMYTYVCICIRMYVCMYMYTYDVYVCAMTPDIHTHIHTHTEEMGLTRDKN